MLDALVRAMARRCGLEDPDAFALAGGVWGQDTAAGRFLRECAPPDADKTRGTGRTTRTLLQALCALECGCSVEVVAADREHAADMRSRLATLVAKAGHDAELLAACGWTWDGGRKGSGHFGEPTDLRLVDHYAAERGAI
jgi:hypothetical protein